MKLFAFATLILSLQVFATQKCYDKVIRTAEDCHQEYDYYNGWQWKCQTDYYEMYCYMVEQLESEHPDHVEQISIHGSNFTELSSRSFSNFQNTKAIIMHQNTIDKISWNTFANLPVLTSIDLTNNNISVLSHGSLNFIGIIALNLTKNGISVIEKNSFNNLGTLILSHNLLLDISNLIENCSSLRILDVSYNKISTITLFENCSSLADLDLSHNRVTKFMTNSTRSLQLITLNLSSNNLTELSNNDLERLDNLHKLDLSNNPLFHFNPLPVDLFENTRNLHFLNLTSTGIQQIVIGTFGSLVNLQMLDLSLNNLTKVERGIFYGLASLQELYLSNNSLAYFEYHGYSKLRKIDLNSNLWTCDTLADVVQNLIHDGTMIVHGYTHHTSNIFGIHCSVNSEDDEQTTSQNLDVDNLQKEYFEFAMKMQQDLQHVLLQLKNKSHSVITNQQNLANIYWSEVSQGHQGFMQKIQETIQDIMDNITIFSTSTKAWLQSDESDETKMEKNSFDEWELFQRNLSETVIRKRLNFEYMQKSLQKSLAKMQENFDEIVEYIKSNNSSSKILTNQIEAVSPNTSKFSSANGQITVISLNHKTLIVGIYGILIILIVGLICVSLMRYRRFRSVQIKHEECSALNTLQV